MGLTSSQDEYRCGGDEAVQGIDRVKKVVDDILIHSSSAQDNLNAVINVLKEMSSESEYFYFVILSH